MADLNAIKATLSEAGVPASQLNSLAPAVQKRGNGLQVKNNLQLFSDFIGGMETGRSGADAYRTSFGGSLLDDLSKHPNISRGFKETTGKATRTTAAGKHQFLKGTWDEMSAKTGVKDFSPASQEANFRQLIKDRGALRDVENGDFTAAIQKLGKTWASLPSSPHPQGKKTWAQAGDLLSRMGAGELAPPTYAGANPPKSKTPIVSEKNIIQAMLPTQEEQMAEAAQTEKTAQEARANVFAQGKSDYEKAIQASANARQSEIDTMLSGAFGFDKAFKQADTLPTVYDDKLLKLIDLA